MSKRYYVPWFVCAMRVRMSHVQMQLSFWAGSTPRRLPEKASTQYHSAEMQIKWRLVNILLKELFQSLKWAHFPIQHCKFWRRKKEKKILKSIFLPMLARQRKQVTNTTSRKTWLPVKFWPIFTIILRFYRHANIFTPKDCQQLSDGSCLTRPTISQFESP